MLKYNNVKRVKIIFIYNRRIQKDEKILGSRNLQKNDNRG